MPRIRFAVHQRLGAAEIRRRPAFDGVRGERERCAGETDQRQAAVELVADEADRFQNVCEPLARIEPPEPIDVCARPDWIRDRWALALDEVERQPERLERHEQVGEEDRGVDVDSGNGCSVTAVARSGARQISRSEYLSRIARYSARYRPAWRMNQTGVTSTGSRLHARRKRSPGPGLTPQPACGRERADPPATWA